MRSRPGFVVPHLSASWSPLDLSGLLGWWDASDAATITESSGAVSQWDDKSGNGYHLTQGTGSVQPTTGTRTLNSLNVIDFANDYMTNASFSMGAVNTLTAIAVIDWDSVNSNGGAVSLVASGHDYNGTDRVRMMVPWQFGPGVGSIYNGSTYMAGNYSTNPVIMSIRRNGADWNRWDNGASHSTASGLSTANWAADRLSVMTGWHGNAPGDGWVDGGLGEVVVYDESISDDDLASLFDYLNTKWAVY